MKRNNDYIVSKNAPSSCMAHMEKWPAGGKGRC